MLHKGAIGSRCSFRRSRKIKILNTVQCEMSMALKGLSCKHVFNFYFIQINNSPHMVISPSQKMLFPREEECRPTIFNLAKSQICSTFLRNISGQKLEIQSVFYIAKSEKSEIGNRMGILLPRE